MCCFCELSPQTLSKDTIAVTDPTVNDRSLLVIYKLRVQTHTEQ